MSAADEDTELRDLLIQTLDKNGVLGKIKAELRSSIFLALESQEDKTENPIKNAPLQKFIATKDGKLCVGIIKQFLEHFNLDYTVAVFSPEVNINESQIDENEITTALNLSGDSPFLPQLVTSALYEKSPPGLDSKQAFLKSKFNSFDRTHSGVIDQSDIATVITLACPHMKRDVINAFVIDELKQLPSQKVSFDDFYNLFRKFYDMCNSVVNLGSQSKSQSLRYGNFSSPQNRFPIAPNNTSQNMDPYSKKKPPGDVGIPSSYLLPISTPERETKMDAGHDLFFDSDIGANMRNRPIDPMYTHIDTPAISPTSSKHDSEQHSKKIRANEESEQQHYEDDFHSEQSISEDIHDMGNDLLHSEKDESLDLTEDHTVSDTPRADYMEDVKHG